MYWSTFILYGPTLIVFGIDGDSKVNRYVFNLIIVPSFFIENLLNMSVLIKGTVGRLMNHVDY